MNVRRLESSDVALVASIDRSEHVEVQYRIEDGRLVEAPVFMADIPTWDPDGSGEHSVASHIAFCASVVADGAALLGAFDDDGELMGPSTARGRVGAVGRRRRSRPRGRRSVPLRLGHSDRERGRHLPRARVPASRSRAPGAVRPRA